MKTLILITALIATASSLMAGQHSTLVSSMPKIRHEEQVRLSRIGLETRTGLQAGQHSVQVSASPKVAGKENQRNDSDLEQIALSLDIGAVSHSDFDEMNLKDRSAHLESSERLFIHKILINGNPNYVKSRTLIK